MVNPYESPQDEEIIEAEVVFEPIHGLSWTEITIWLVAIMAIATIELLIF